MTARAWQTGGGERARAREAGRARRSAAAGPLRGLLRASRPRQWSKNLLVLAAPAAAGVLDEPRELARSVAAVVCFCLVSSGGYLVNDAVDAAADRRHPRKQHRPVAAGTLPRALAALVGASGLLVGTGLGWALAPALGALLACYGVLTLAYSLRLKHVPYVDLAVIATGFVFRAVAGGVAARVALSGWFLAVASAGSLLVAVGKRAGELAQLGAGGSEHRPTLGRYRGGALLTLGAVAATVTVGAYGLWAFERAGPFGDGAGFFELSIIPFAVAVARYGRLAALGQGSDPEELFFSDRKLELLAALCALSVALGVYSP
jgi:decaprenyl-phosphate phosphoribosyltransferase